MVDLLRDNPMLLLFVVVAIGYPLGRIRVAGTSLGVAAVLFAGIAIGSLDPGLKLPEIIYQLGLVLFVYTIGLSSGRAFFASFRHTALRDNALVVGLLAVGAGLVAAAYALLDLRATLAVGMFTGSLTSTPALASVLEYLNDTYAGAANLDQMLADPVVGYSVTYPMGVIGMLLAIALAQRIWKVDYASEARTARELGVTSVRLENRTIRVTRPDTAHETLHDLTRRHDWGVVFGRMRQDEQLRLADAGTRLRPGDLVSLIGEAADIERATSYLGEPSDEHLELDRTELDFRRVFVSNPRVAGRRLRDLGLPQQYGALVTRVRRGDVESLPTGDSILELGDRVRVVTHRDQMDAVSAYLGDSYRSLSEIDFVALALGITAGLLLGLVPIPAPGDVTLKLGFAGGPLIVALVLGALERSGPLVWNLPYSANLTLRQFGLVLFLAAVGTRAGDAFISTLTSANGLTLFLAGGLITASIAVLTLWIGHKLVKIPMGVTIGMLAGLQTQPAVLGFALDQTQNELPNLGYATVYPVATITKILLAQVLLASLL